MKCEHGQIITKFCISEQCSHKISASCSYCLKKHHIHPGTLETLSYDQFNKLISNLTSQNDNSSKQSTLKQLLTNYFQTLKYQISKSLDQVCKNMIDSVTHPVLYKQNLLETYKKASTKNYSKISVQELRKLNKFHQKNCSNFQQKQNQIYKSEVKNIKSSTESLNYIFESYQHVIESYNKNFVFDTFILKRISALTEKILKQNNQKCLTQVKQVPIKICKSEKVEINRQYEPLNKELPKVENEYPQIMSFEQYKNMRSVQILKSKQNLNLQELNAKNEPKKRKVSIAQQSKSSEQNKEEAVQPKIPKRQLKTSSQKSKLPCKCEQNQRIKSDPTKTNIINSCSNENIDTNNHEQHSECKQCEFFELKSSKERKKQILPNKNIQFFASHKDHQIIRHFEQKEHLEKKIIKLDITEISLNNSQETDSPLLKKKIQTKEKPSSEHQNISQIQNINYEFSQNNQISNTPIDLAKNQLKSLSLLLEAIKLPAEKALKYLRKSFQLCPSNLSTAQYLSFLLIQENHPKQCLELCNFMIVKLHTHTSHLDDSCSFHILNNKGAALNMLGRFSQSIQFLERILSQNQHPSLYKNLGDAYFALGIYEKSILNYQKCISLDNGFDEAFFNLAVCFYLQHHYQEAFDMAQKALKINPEQEEYRELLINAKAKLV